MKEPAKTKSKLRKKLSPKTKKESKKKGEIVLSVQVIAQTSLSAKKGARILSDYEKQRLARAKKSCRCLSRYYCSLSKCLFKIYYSVCDQSYKDDQHLPQNSKDIHPVEIYYFVENRRLFLKILRLFQINRFPSIEDALGGEFQYKFLDEEPSKTFLYGLYLMRQEQQLSSTDKVFLVTEIQVKCLYIITILLVGIRPQQTEQIDLPEIETSSESSIQTLFNKTVRALLAETKLLNRGVLNYLIDAWQPIQEMAYSKIPAQPQREVQPQRNQPDIDTIIPRNHNYPVERRILNLEPTPHQRKTTTKYNSKKITQTENQIEKKNHERQIQWFTNHNSCRGSKSNFRHDDDQFCLQSNNSWFGSQNQSQSEAQSQQKISPPQVACIEQKKPSQMHIYAKRSYDLWNYNGLKHKEENRKKKQQRKRKKIQMKKKQQQKEKQISVAQEEECFFSSSNNHLSSLDEGKTRDHNSISLGHTNQPEINQTIQWENREVNHNSRELDYMVDMLDDDDFVIAHSIANHIYRSLQAADAKLQSIYSKQSQRSDQKTEKDKTLR